MKIYKFNEEFEDDNLKNIKDELTEMVHDTVGSDSPALHTNLMEEYIDNSAEVNIEGIINDSDVYDFYLKYTNEIDEVLSEKDYFEEIPSQNNINGLYNYVVYSTKKGICYIFEKIMEDE